MLELSGELNGTGGFSTPMAINSFVSSDTLIASSAIDNWILRATLKPGTVLVGAEVTTCAITLAVDAWQDNLPLGQGFNDHEEIVMNPITGSEFVYNNTPLGLGCTHNPNIVLNEFLPNPVGDDSAAMPGGEWVELYNADNHPVDLNGWLLYTSDTRYGMTIYSGNTNNGSTIIYPGGFLVVFRNGDPNFEIKNSGAEELRLFDRPIGEGVEDIDGVSYDAIAPEGKSFARIPDGIGEWIDPKPTPGEPNELSELEAANPQKLDTVEVGGEVETQQAEPEQIGGAVSESDLAAGAAEELAEEDDETDLKDKQTAEADEKDDAVEAEAPVSTTLEAQMVLMGLDVDAGTGPVVENSESDPSQAASKYPDGDNSGAALAAPAAAE
jgi:hypothetical protein